MEQGTWTIRPCPHRESSVLAQGLGISEITASVLVRRGYGDPDEARALLAGEQPLHDPFLLGDMRVAVERIRAAIAGGRRICVHGDYDADGICATALAVLVLREAGADVDWHLPSRFDEGYGVNGETLTRLAEEGCGLVLTVDCGITAVEEVALAQMLGLEIVVTDHHRAGDELPVCPLADRLEELNRDRQAVEERILRAAIEQVEEWPEAKRRGRAYVLWGEDWHEGVIGIVASRLVERYHRPVVLIAGTDGRWKGSGRSIPAFDLHGALGACAGLLGRWGGHRAAAGLSIAEENVDAFAAAFAEQAAAVLAEEDLEAVTSIDAVVARKADLSLDLCAELRRLAPFGLGNPAPVLLAPGCGLAEVATVGDGKHLRFRVRRGGRDAGSAIAFGQGSRLEVLRPDVLYDVAFRLEENHWNGTVAPQLVVRRVFASAPRYCELREWFAQEWVKPAAARDPDAAAVFAELGLDDGAARRDLLESARFRALLAADPPLARAA